MPTRPLPLALLAPLRLPLRLVPAAVHAEIGARVFNHLMRGQALTGRLAALNGKTIGLHITDAPTLIRFRIEDGRLARHDGTASDVTIRGALDEFWRLATRAEDPDTLFFSRRLAIEGDTETGLHVKNLLDALDYDIEAHVRAVLGGAAAPLLPLIQRLIALRPGRRA
jgi:predicted lipid carrier protein YhbT